MYIHELASWPGLYWDKAQLTDLLAEVRYRQGLLLGRMQTLGFDLRERATLQTLTQDVLDTSEIEGERLDTYQVRSSIARRLGIPGEGNVAIDRHVEGIVEVLLDATRRYNSPVNVERLNGWHAALFPTGWSGLSRITVGTWRTPESDPMQVVSRTFGRTKIHYEAPPAQRVSGEMTAFLRWFEQASEDDPLVRAAVAQFWFLTIHPFDDGNGRIGRALADMMLARAEQSSQRFYSMSSQILREKADYYAILERCQRGSLDITAWIVWFLGCLGRAIDASQEILERILAKARFWDRHNNETFNERQRKIINLLLDGFQGNLTTAKWATLGKTSKPTAQRDIAELVERQILMPGPAGGRSTHYLLANP